MRSGTALFVVSALLFVFGIGFVIVGSREARRASSVPARSAAPPVLATTTQVMSSIVGPASTAIFQAVQWHMTDKGTEAIAPKSDTEWTLLGAQAAALAEAGYMLMAEGRAVDRGDWMKMSQAMVDAAKKSLEAIERRNPDDVLASGEAIVISCDTCHERYWRR